MRKIHWLLPTLALTLVAVMLTDTLAQRAPATALVATRVAVCNMAALSENYNRSKDIREKMSQRGQQAEAEQRARREKIEQLRQSLGMLEPGTPAHKQQMDQLDDLLAEYDAWVKKQSRQAQRMQEYATRTMYQDLRSGIAAVAQAKGAHTVLFYESDPPPAKDLQELMLRIQSTEVLYNDGTNDITDDVLKHLNAKWAKESAAGEPVLPGL